MSWANMKARCLNNFTHYENVDICERWLGKDGFLNFLSDMGERPTGTSIDRIDSQGNYEPSNCRWSTVQEQNDNRNIVSKNMSRPVKLNEEVVLQIRKLYDEGMKQVELSKQFKLSSGMVSRIVNRKSWDWI